MTARVSGAVLIVISGPALIGLLSGPWFVSGPIFNKCHFALPGTSESGWELLDPEDVVLAGLAGVAAILGLVGAIIRPRFVRMLVDLIAEAAALWRSLTRRVRTCHAARPSRVGCLDGARRCGSPRPLPAHNCGRPS
jgi:hypothetical protein